MLGLYVSEAPLSLVYNKLTEAQQSSVGRRLADQISEIRMVNERILSMERACCSWKPSIGDTGNSERCQELIWSIRLGQNDGG